MANEVLTTCQVADTINEDAAIDGRVMEWQIRRLFL